MSTTLWYLTLGINVDEGIRRQRAEQADHPLFERIFISDFSYETRSLCNYLLRYVRQKRFKTDGFNQISINGSLSEQKPPYIDSSQTLRCDVLIDFQKYQRTAKTQDKLNEFFIDLLIEGFERVKNRYSIPLDDYLHAIDDFRTADYVNEWKVKSRRFADLGFSCSLFASLDIERFQLDLVVRRGRNEIYREPVVKTKPDEIHFRRHLKDVLVKDDRICVTEPIQGRVIWSTPLAGVL